MTVASSQSRSRPGDRTKLGTISKRGNKYLRTLFVQATHVFLERRPAAAMRALWRPAHAICWLSLANKVARVAWAVLARGRERRWLRGDGFA